MKETSADYELCSYNTDASGIKGNALKVFFPESASDVQRIVRESSDIVPRGSGSSLSGGCIPQNSVVIDLGLLNRVSDFDSKKNFLYVGAGITVKELNEKLKPWGYEFPVFLLEKEFSTIGGMISLNVAGDRSMRYGTIRDWVEEIDFVSGRGELMKAGKAELMDFCGMEGTTGIIVGAKIKVFNLVNRSASIFQSENIEEILSVARRLKLEKEVTMLKFFSKQTSRIIGLPEKYNLIIEFNSQRGKIKGKDYERVLKNIKKIFYSLYSNGYYPSEDPKLFFDKIRDFVLLLEQKNIPYVGDLGMGIIQPFFKASEGEKKEEISNLLKKSRAKISKYGYGLLRKNYLEESERKILSRVKLRHDPFWKLNKNKFISAFKQTESEKYSAENKLTSPNLGEKRSAEELLEGLKTPEEKIEDFIKQETEREEAEKSYKDSETDSQKNFQNPSEKIQSEIMDYEQTFSSELPFERRIKIEEFAREIPKEAAKKREVKVDYNEIKDIMTNKYGFNVKRGNLGTGENDESESAKKNSMREKTTSEEQDIINRVMMNNFDSEEKISNKKGKK